jgi:hypothetical protein
MTEAEWLVSTDPDALLRFVSEFPQTERKWICAALAFSEWLPTKPDKVALDLMGTVARYADGLISRQQVANAFEAAQRGDGIDVTFNHEETTLYLQAAAQGQVNGRMLASAIRDIFGYPLRPVPIDATWLTWREGIIPRLAEAIYNNRGFTDMPILAVALEETGCTDADILNHCRQPGTHVRGCWVVDLLLGKK